jgi:RNA 3'-terminal phosphate cyclase (ATP)
MKTMIEIDGSRGEGGGQILRTSLSLSLLTGRPFRMEKIRAGRSRPGLLRQHLTAVTAAAAVGRARVQGDTLGSQTLIFEPAELSGGQYDFAVGSAGSATLVMQTILPALLHAKAPSTVRVSGGTHNPASPPFDFLERTFLPVLRSMGGDVHARLERPGFYPAGGGVLWFTMTPSALQPLTLTGRGAMRSLSVTARVAGLPRQIAEREVDVFRAAFGTMSVRTQVETLPQAHGPGNVVVASIESEQITETMTTFGEKGVKAEIVAENLVSEVRRYLAAPVPVGEHLADQLLLPMAIAGGGSFRSLRPSLHATTQAETLRLFTDVRVEFQEEAEDVWHVTVHPGGIDR